MIKEFKLSNEMFWKKGQVVYISREKVIDMYKQLIKNKIIGGFNYPMEKNEKRRTD